MSNLPPTDDDPEDGLPVDQERFDELRREAQEIGLHYTGKDPVELEAFLALAKAEQGASHPVACYGLSYEPTDRRCRICQLRGPCSEKDLRPHVVVTDISKLEDVMCEACGTGSLSVELLSQDSVEGEAREIRDFGCTTPGCLNTLGIQCGWEQQPERQQQEIAFAPRPEVRLEGVQKPLKPEKPGGEPPGGEPPAKKTKKKPAGKKPAGKPKLKIVEPAPEPTPVVKRRTSTKGLAFLFGGKKYGSLSAIAALVTGTRNWSGAKFFGVDPAEVIAGVTVERVWEGKQITVKVVQE